MQVEGGPPLLTTPPNLPNEIKSLIINHIDTTTDLLTLLIVSSEFREIVEKVLYRDISFDCTSSQDCACIGCLRTIRSRPAAAAAVRSFEVFLPRPMASCLEEYYQTFPYMVDLEELVMLSMNSEDVWIFEGVAFPKLKYFRGPPTALSRMSNSGVLWALKVSDYAIDTPTLLETVIPLTIPHRSTMVHLSLQLKDSDWRDYMMDMAQGFPNLTTLSIEVLEEIEEVGGVHTEILTPLDPLVPMTGRLNGHMQFYSSHPITEIPTNPPTVLSDPS